MKKIESCVCLAPKLIGSGNIKHCLWVDNKGGLFAQIVENKASGTFTRFLLSLSKYQSARNSAKALGKLEAYNLESNEFEEVKDNNKCFCKGGSHKSIAR